MIDHISPSLRHLAMPISSFRFDEDNVLIHSDEDIQATAASLREHGQLEPIVVNARQNNRVLNGNSRLRGALDILGWAEIAAVIIDVSPEEADKIAVDLNATGRNLAAVWNDDVLRRRLDAAKAKGLEIHGLGEGKLAALRARLNGQEVDDPLAEWQGMPEFEQEDNFGSITSVKVHFSTLDDIATFAQLVEQTVNEKTTNIWFPKLEKLDLTKYKAINEP